MSTRITRDFPPPDITVNELLRAAAERYGDAPFLSGGAGQTITRRELDRAASRFANALLKLGLPAGSPAGVFSPNSIPFIIACYGVLRSGLTLTPFNSAYRRRELLHQIRDSGASVVFADKRLLPTIEECAAEIPGCRIIELAPKFWESAPGDNPQVDVDAGRQVAFLPYSSGTTGLPKGVQLTHRNLLAAIRQILSASEDALGADDAVYCFLPLYHIYGFNVVLNTALAAGSRIHIRERFDLDDCLATVEREGITWLPVVPPVVLAMLARTDLGERNLRSLGSINVGAAPVALAAVERLRKLTGVEVRQGYGMTETAGIASTNPSGVAWDPAETAGIAVPWQEMKIFDLAAGEKELGVNEVGELALRGPNIMLGYRNAPEENRRVLRNGWFYTGDIAKIDDLGRLHLVDRRREMIKYKGFQVTPAELESVILELADVRDCAVVGKKDPVAGEVPKAYVVMHDSKQLAPERIMDHVAGQVAGYKKVREVEFVDHIPRSPAGKILRRMLQ